LVGVTRLSLPAFLPTHSQVVSAADVWISKEKAVVPLHLAFQAKNRKQVEAFYDAALKAGAKDNGGPGYRDYSPGYFAAFVIDPDGNNIEAHTSYLNY
jgi:catechol 2,3-dioxygenase-like lactoylglutathione lyase family enzyme